jgi:hypothetical protein
MSRVKKNREHYERLLIGDEERLRKIKIEKEITACIRKETGSETRNRVSGANEERKSNEKKR